MRLLLLLALLAPACARAGEPGAQPENQPDTAVLTIEAREDAPVATLTYGDETQQAALGTRCWATQCVDYIGPPQPEAFTRVPAGTMLVLEADQAARVSATIGTPADEEFQPAVGAREFDLTDGREALDLDPGRYVLELFVTWRSQGDAVMTLGLELT